jgi:hypothetical protein
LSDELKKCALTNEPLENPVTHEGSYWYEKEALMMWVSEIKVEPALRVPVSMNDYFSPADLLMELIQPSKKASKHRNLIRLMARIEHDARGRYSNLARPENLEVAKHVEELQTEQEREITHQKHDFFTAATMGWPGIIKKVLASRRVSIYATNETGKTALDLATEHAKIRTAVFILKQLEQEPEYPRNAINMIQTALGFAKGKTFDFLNKRLSTLTSQRDPEEKASAATVEDGAYHS